MIDFRYHLVSLVSVFLALAIGVVLGAGPLRGPLSDTLSTQVAALREDKANLQKAVTNRDTEITTQNTALAALGEQVSEGALAGHRVIGVVLPGANPAEVAGYEDLLAKSGAVDAGTITIGSDWSNPAAHELRQKSLTALSAVTTELAVPAGDSEATKLAKVLAAAVSTTTPAAPRSASAQTSLTELTAAKLITTSNVGDHPADLVVVFAAGPGSGAAGDENAWQSAELDANKALVAALDASSVGVVVDGPVSSANGKGLLADLRSTAPSASTVDGTNAAAAVGIVLGLVQQAAGGAGHYGSGTGATAVLPPIITPQPSNPAVEPAPEATTP